MGDQQKAKKPVYNDWFTTNRIKEICKGNLVLEIQMLNIVEQVRLYERKRRLG